MTTTKRKSRYDIDDDAAPAATTVPVVMGTVPWGSPEEAQEARRVLESARADVERVVQAQMRGLELTLAAKADALTAKLRETRAEIERLERETESMRQNRYDEVLARLKDRVNAL